MFVTRERIFTVAKNGYKNAVMLHNPLITNFIRRSRKEVKPGIAAKP
jgi:hypothetical protein